MRCALVLCIVARVFVVVYSEPELCVFSNDYGEKEAYCGRYDVEYTFDFIPPIYQNISSIDIEGQPLNQLVYNAFRNLSSQSSITRIDLEGCVISHVDADALLNLHNLTTIDLSHNDITKIDSKFFSHTKQIKFIYMPHNKIEVLPSGLFQNLTLLDEVVLYNNRIRQVELFSFTNTLSLRSIDLGYNQIESMNVLFKDEFDNLTTLWLYDNPWECNCELRPLYELLIKINALNQEDLVCEKPPTLQGKQWSDISIDEFVCPSQDTISTQGSVMTSASTEPMTTTEQDDNIPVTDYNGTRYQQVDTGIPQPPSNQNWIPYTISVLVLVCVAAVIIGVVLFKRRSFRGTYTRNMDSDLSMRIIQSRAMSENCDSTLNMADVDKEQTSNPLL